MKTDFGNNILNISAKLFREFGFEAITMNDIAKNAAISENHLKENYPDKEAIINELASLFFKAQEKYCNNIQGFNSVKEEFSHIMEYCSGFLAEFTPLLGAEIRNYYPKVWGLFLYHRDNIIIEKIKINFEKGIKEGVYCENFDVDITAKLCVEQVQLAFDKLLFLNEDYSKREVLNVIIKNIFYFICK